MILILRKAVKSILIVFVILFTCAACFHPNDNINTYDNITSQGNIIRGGTGSGYTSDGGGKQQGSMAQDTGEEKANHSELLNPRNLVNPEGRTIEERFDPPEGFTRIEAEEGSFCEYLRKLPLLPDGSPVKYFDGRTKHLNVHAAVIDMDIGTRDLQQCADAVIRLRAEYLYSTARYDRIHFNFTNGFNAEYSKWRDGYRIAVEGNNAFWRKSAGYSNDYSTFRKYLDVVFAYAGTLSLSREMEPIAVKDAKPGDVFIEGGSPGHSVIIVDMAVNNSTGEKVFMIAQSYMPAQNIYILINDVDKNISPWYYLNFGQTLKTPQWEFDAGHLMRFRE